MWQELPEDDPELVVDSPPCTPFSPLIARVGFSSDAFRGCGCHGGRGLGAHRHSLSGGNILERRCSFLSTLTGPKFGMKIALGSSCICQAFFVVWWICVHLE